MQLEDYDCPDTKTVVTDWGCYEILAETQHWRVRYLYIREGCYAPVEGIVTPISGTLSTVTYKAIDGPAEAIEITVK